MNDILSYQGVVLLLAKGILLCCGAIFLAFLLKRASASYRSLVWNLTFIGLLTLTLGLTSLPGVEIQWRQAVAEDIAQQRVLGSEYELSVAESRAVILDGPAPTLISRVPDLFDVGFILLTIWMIGFLVALLWQLYQVVLLNMLSRRADECRVEGYLGLLGSVSRLQGVEKSIRLVTSSQIASPMTWGFFRPEILLPLACSGWSESTLQAVLEHEVSHIKRRDYVAILLTELACAVHWCNPIVWLARKRSILDREVACDNQVISSGTTSSSYAGDLLTVARAVRRADRWLHPAAAMSGTHQLRARIESILDTSRQRSKVSTNMLHSISLVFILGAVLFACVRPADAQTDIAVPPADMSDVSGEDTQVFFPKTGITLTVPHEWEPFNTQSLVDPYPSFASHHIMTQKGNFLALRSEDCSDEERRQKWMSDPPTMGAVESHVSLMTPISADVHLGIEGGVGYYTELEKPMQDHVYRNRGYAFWLTRGSRCYLLEITALPDSLEKNTAAYQRILAGLDLPDHAIPSTLPGQVELIDLKYGMETLARWTESEEAANYQKRIAEAEAELQDGKYQEVLLKVNDLLVFVSGEYGQPNSQDSTRFSVNVRSILDNAASVKTAMEEAMAQR